METVACKTLPQSLCQCTGRLARRCPWGDGVGTGHWRKRLRDYRCHQLRGGHLQGRKRQLEAQLTLGALGGSAGPRSAPLPPAAVKDRAEPKAEGPCPTLPSSPALSHLKVPGGPGSPLTSLVPGQGSQAGVSPRAFSHPWPRAALRRHSFNLGKSPLPL